MPSRVQRELALLVTGKDVSATKTLKNVNREVGNLQKAAGKAGANVSRNIQRGVVLGAGAAAGAIGYAINVAQDWESAFAGVAKTIEGDVSDIGVGIRQMATEIPTAATELAAIAEAAGALGVAKDDVLGFTHTVALLGETTDLTTDAASTALGHLRTNLQLTGEDFDHIGNSVVALGNKGASTESQILGMAESISGVAANVGLANDAVLGWGAALANTGEEVEAGGSAIQRFFLSGAEAARLGTKELKTWAKVSGVSTAQFQRDFDRDASGTMERFIVKLGDLTKAEQQATLEALGFTDIRISRALMKLLGNTDNLTDSLNTSRDAWNENNAMTIEAEKRFKTTASQVAVLKNNFDEAAIVIGTELLPVIADLAAEGVDWLRGHQPEIAQFAKDLAVGIRDAVKWAKSLDWDAIGSALGAGAGFAKTLVEAFVNAPPWLQQFLAVGFVANKFTGGALQDVFSSLATGLIKGVLGINAGVVNIRAGAVAGAGGGGVITGGKGGGKLATAAGAIGKVFIVGAAAGIFAELLQERGAQQEQNRQLTAGISEQGAMFVKSATLDDMKESLAGLDALHADLNSGFSAQELAFQANIDGVRTTIEAEQARLREAIAQGEASGTERERTAAAQRERLFASEIAEGKRAADRAYNQAEASRMAGAQQTFSQIAAISRAETASRAAGQQAAAAIRDKDLSVTVPVVNNISTTVSVREGVVKSKSLNKVMLVAS